MTGQGWPGHALAGIEFPPVVGDFIGGDIQQHDSCGHDLSVGYSWPATEPEIKITFYVYPADDSTDAEEIERAVRGVTTSDASAQVVDAARSLVFAACEGTHVNLSIDTAEGVRVPTCVSLYRVEDWFVKIRTTAATSTPRLDCGSVAERLVRQLGLPNMRQRINTGLHRLACLAEESIAALRSECNAEHARSQSMRACLEHLQAGALADATEICMAMEEEGEPGTAVVERALRNHFPPTVTFSGGVGDTELRPVVVNGARTDDELVAACRSYLECVLGTPDDGWHVTYCHVLLTRNGVVDAIQVEGPHQQAVTVFFRIQDTHLEVEDPILLCEIDMVAQDRRLPFSLSKQVPDDLAMSLIVHVGSHTTQWLLRRADSPGHR